MALTGHRAWARTSAGSIIAGAAVEVRRVADNSLATLYTDAGGGTGVSNPFTTEADGSYVFYTEPDRYNVLVGTGASQETVPLDLTDGRAQVPWPSRAQAVSDIAGGFEAADGTIKSDGTVQYVASAGATAISDMPGWLPFGRVSFHTFGAVGDGVTDETSKVQSAVNYGGDVHLEPSKTYVVTTIRPNDNTRIIGDRTSKIIQKDSTLSDLVSPTQATAGSYESVTFSGFELNGFVLDGNKDNQTVDATWGQRLVYGTFHNMKISGMEFINSVRGDVRLTQCQDVVIERNKFDGGGKWLGGLNDGSAIQNIAVRGENTRNVTIRENYLRGVGAAVFAAFPSYTTGVNNVSIIVEDQAYDVDIIANYFTEVSNECVQYIRWPSAAPNTPQSTFRPGKSVVAFNTFDGQYKTSFGINCGENADTLIVSNNVVRGMVQNGIKVTPWMRDVTIEGNKVEGSGATGILVSTGVVDVFDKFGKVSLNGNTVISSGSHGIQCIGDFDKPLYGLCIANNICADNGQADNTAGGIRIAVPLNDAIIAGNLCYDDQVTQTQGYGLIVAAPSGGAATFNRVKIHGNELQGNLRFSSLFIAGTRVGISFSSNTEGATPALYNYKFDYDLNASASSAQQVLPSDSIGKPITTAFIPSDDAGVAAFGAPVAVFSASSAAIPFIQVRNLTSGARAVGSVYLYW